jgi:RHS repeat-associated protein
MGKSGAAGGQAISLPKGGGSLQGIGETFSADLQTGTGNFSVPIAIPPGRNGFQPQLSLGYSTGTGNGPFGLGWRLSIPGISRKTSKGVPRYDDASDVFILSGAEDLVSVAGAPAGAVRFRPRTEGLFAHIDHYRDRKTGDDYWRVSSKDGLVSIYGAQAAHGDELASIADPDKPAHVFSWSLTSTTDPFGNRIEYAYERDAKQSDGPHHWDQVYLSQIRYVDHGDRVNPQYLVTANFIYEDRPDPFSEYRSGFEIRTVRRCVRIETWTHAGAARLVRSYDLVYLDQHTPRQPLPFNGASVLGQIQVTGHDGALTEALAPLQLGYTQFAPERRKFLPLSGPDLPPGALTRPDCELVDLFGSGLSDLLQMNGAVRYWRNRGGGRFDLARDMRDAPAGLQLTDPAVQLIDADGDGRLDLLVNNSELSGYFPLRFGALWDRRSFKRYRAAPSFSLKDPEVRLLDIDGDGVTDAVRSGSRIECFFNDPVEGWTETRFVEREALEVFPNINFSDPRVRFADMTGDSLQDPVLLYDGNCEYWPSRGRGRWGKRIHMRNSPRFPYGYDPRRILIGDVDGDGLADIVYVDDTKVTLWINQSGNAWSDPIVIEGTPPVFDTDAIRLADVFGAGISGVLWSGDANGAWRGGMYFLDFTGGTKPYLLNEMNNSIGAVTRVAYRPSTDFYLQDQKHPATRWKTPLPFPVQVVARVEVIDAISKGKLTTEYRYHHGYWDGAEREFRGFGRVDRRDTEVFDEYHGSDIHPGVPFEPVQPAAFSPPTESRTWFHQGPVGDEFGDWQELDFSAEFWPGDAQVLTRPPEMVVLLKKLPRRARRDALRTLRGTVLRTELYARDGTIRQNRPYTVTESLSGVREEEPPSLDQSNRARIFFPHEIAQRTTQWERGEGPTTPMTQFAFTGDYDVYGQARSQIGIAVPRGRDFRASLPANSPPVEPYLSTYTVTTYAQPAGGGRYIVDRVARSTIYEIRDHGKPSVFMLRDLIATQSPPPSVIGQTRNFYDGLAFTGLAFGQIGDYGALTRTESLVLTETILQDAYRSGDTVTSPPEEPAYFARSGPPPWTGDYPQEFRDLLPPMAGYIFYAGGPDPADARGFFVATSKQYDFQSNAAAPARGLIVTQRDPLGRDTVITYDSFDLLLLQITDPAGLKTSAIYDYRVLQPSEVADPNGNRTRVAFSPLGIVNASWVKGAKPGEGDLQRPGAKLTYDFFAFTKQGQPIFVRTLRQIHHDGETDVPQPERDATIESVEYSDGFGRLLQTRAQAEDVIFGDAAFGDAGLSADQSTPAGAAVGQSLAPGAAPNVMVSGWQVYDNKGRVVEKYEPFFSTGWDFAPPTDAQRGQKATMFYDPRGQLVRTVNPDNSEQRVIHGVPADLAAPDAFEPTPWEAYTYDVNDNAGRTHPATSASYQAHWNTPASIVVDALGRTVSATVRNGPNPSTDWYTNASTYDIRGNLLTVTDPLGRVAFRHVYDLAKHALRIESIDAGRRRTMLDAVGNVVEGRDSKGALLLTAYDLLSRPIRQWASDGAGQALTLRQRTDFGDGVDAGLTSAQAAAANLLGKAYRHYDEAGRLTLEAYDFKGNPLEKTREVIADSEILSVFGPAASNNWQVAAYRVDWQPPAGTTLAQRAGALLDPTVYRTSITYDALSRVKAMLYPQDVESRRRQLVPAYNRAGALESVTLDGATFVARIAYTAKGQRSLVAYGNGVMTRHAHDPQTFRLVRLRSERFSQPAPLTFHPTGTPLQDFAYQHDLAGNIIALRDRTPASGIQNTVLGTEAFDRRFAYDPIYRLIAATGRETAAMPPAPPWDDTPRSEDLTLARAYTETYDYDLVGNIAQISHQAGAGSFVRVLALAPGSNRLATVTVAQTSYAYSYDTIGNLTDETTSRHFEWDSADRMRVFRTQTSGAEPSVHAHYLYDGGGQRVKKLVRKQGGRVEVTVYIDGAFEHHRLVQAGVAQENDTLHVIDNQNRIALVRVGVPFPGDASPVVAYHLGDHLGSSNITIDAGGAWTNREEYSPYGETSFGSFARKCYRFTGKECDQESGLYYHGARYYAPWVGRWTSCDPIGPKSRNSYQYCNGSPINLIDPDGKDPIHPRTGRPVTEDNAENAAAVARANSILDLQQPADEKIPDPVAEEMPRFKGRDLQSIVHEARNAGVTIPLVCYADPHRENIRLARQASVLQPNTGPGARRPAPTTPQQRAAQEQTIMWESAASNPMAAVWVFISLGIAKVLPWQISPAHIGIAADWGSGALDALGAARSLQTAAPSGDPLYGNLYGEAWGAPLAPVGRLIRGLPLPPLFPQIDPVRSYSQKPFERGREEPGPHHNFPISFDETVFSYGQRWQVNDRYILYTQPGSINGESGVYGIGVEPSVAGTGDAPHETVTHRHFEMREKYAKRFGPF